MSNYEKLAAINVNDKTEKKNGLTYLSWAWAWAEFLKVCPEATYEIEKNENGLPYFSDKTGACVFTSVTVGDTTRSMWLPVMDGANKAMKDEPYTYQDRYGNDKTVAAYTMFDINKTLMRCLTKNLGMFGLALYIFAGEDMPDTPPEPVQLITEDQAYQIDQLISETNSDLEKFYTAFGGISAIEQLPASKYKTAVDLLEAKKAKVKK